MRSYEKHGVKEYILIHPIENYVERYLLDKDGIYGRGDIFGAKEILPLAVLEGLDIELAEVFEEK